ncbi:stage III sporulation protein AA [Halobacillus campisalis]|uniref:Stage III sporulation protein AA n=1 Tax=Halobacillus campisalis TaxID=435909 RepID=A0ABW2K2A4_9BACI|nr:stage III sporulation protein AA [Halobacillus campisalis]
MKEIIRLFPNPYHPAMHKKINWNTVQEIRLRVNRCLEVTDTNGVSYVTDQVAGRQDLSYVLNQVSQFSVYKFKEEMKEGFITIEGGHRIGLAGKTNIHERSVEVLKDITFMNIRVARSSIDSGRKVLPYLLNEGKWLNTLIIGPPHSGKTTVLRNLAKWIGSGTEFKPASKVALVDERSEIAACKDGVPQLEVGERTDVMDGCPKAVGMMMMIRSMSPEVIIVDEIGGTEDALAIKEAIYTGVQVICSVHGNNQISVARRQDVQELIENQAFDRFIILNRLSASSSCIEVLDEKGSQLIRLKGEGDHGVVGSTDRTSRHHVGRF